MIAERCRCDHCAWYVNEPPAFGCVREMLQGSHRCCERFGTFWALADGVLWKYMPVDDLWVKA